MPLPERHVVEPLPLPVPLPLRPPEVDEPFVDDEAPPRLSFFDPVVEPAARLVTVLVDEPVVFLPPRGGF